MCNSLKQPHFTFTLLLRTTFDFTAILISKIMIEQNQTPEIMSLPRIGDKAPEFKAITTQGEINFPADYQGKWIILFSHPADFTPVCTSEFMTFAKRAPEFSALNCQLVGLSIDGLYSHIAWLRTIKDKIEFKGMKNMEVTFPLIEDITMAAANKYGVIQPGESSTKAVRAVSIAGALTDCLRRSLL